MGADPCELIQLSIQLDFGGEPHRHNGKRLRRLGVVTGAQFGSRKRKKQGGERTRRAGPSVVHGWCLPLIPSCGIRASNPPTSHH
jgi:hypothetical protein